MLPIEFSGFTHQEKLSLKSLNWENLPLKDVTDSMVFYLISGGGFNRNFSLFAHHLYGDLPFVIRFPSQFSGNAEIRAISSAELIDWFIKYPGAMRTFMGHLANYGYHLQEINQPPVIGIRGDGDASLIRRIMREYKNPVVLENSGKTELFASSLTLPPPLIESSNENLVNTSELIRGEAFENGSLVNLSSGSAFTLTYEQWAAIYSECRNIYDGIIVRLPVQKNNTELSFFLNECTHLFEMSFLELEPQLSEFIRLRPPTANRKNIDFEAWFLDYVKPALCHKNLTIYSGGWGRSMLPEFSETSETLWGMGWGASLLAAACLQRNIPKKFQKSLQPVYPISGVYRQKSLFQFLEKFSAAENLQEIKIEIPANFDNLQLFRSGSLTDALVATQPAGLINEPTLSSEDKLKSKQANEGGEVEGGQQKVDHWDLLGKAFRLGYQNITWKELSQQSQKSKSFTSLLYDQPTRLYGVKLNYEFISE